jgi:putative PEP-CTERM system TPR-repeat lipoprotein
MLLNIEGSPMRRNPSKLKLSAALLSGAFLIAGLSGCNRMQSTQSLLSDAKQYEQKGELKAALIQLKNAVEKSPDDGEARLALGTLALKMGDSVSAEKELRKARSLGVAPDRTLPGLGKALLLQGHGKALLTEITPALAAKSAPLLTLRGNALLNEGKPEEAKQAFDQALGLNKSSGDALLGLARLSMMNNDRAGAERYVQDAVAADPKNPEVFMLKGSLLRTNGKADDALIAYDQALALDPLHRAAHIEKAYVQISQGKYPAAKTELDAAEKNSPGNLLVAYTRALSEFSQGHFAAAEDYLQSVLKSSPDHMPSILLSGASELNLGSTQAAEQKLRKYLESNPGDVYARKLLAQALLKSPHPEDAAATLAPALKTGSDDPQLLMLAGQSSMQARDFNKASDYFERAAVLVPKLASVHTSLGLARLAQGDAAKGLSELQLATTLDPKSIQAATALAQADMNLKRYDEALATVQQLEKQQPNNPLPLNLEAVIQMVRNNMPAARAALDKAVALQPSFMPAILNQARLDLAEKKPEVAKQRYQKVIAKEPNNMEALRALGELAVIQNHPEEATGWYEKASNVHPEEVGPAVTLGQHYLRTKQPEKALTLARKLQTANATNPELLQLLGEAQVATKNPSGALETYSKLANVLPKSALPQFYLANVHILLKNEAAANEDLKHAVELQPNFLPARMAQADMAMRANHPDDALDVAHQVQKLDPRAPVGYALEGDVMLMQKKFAPALAAYEKALAITKSPEVFAKSLQALNGAGRGQEASVRARQWLTDHPDDLRVTLMAAEGSLAAKDYKPAVALLEGATKYAPNNPLLLNNLAWAYGQLKDPRALATAERAFALGANNPGIMDTLGWMLVEQDNVARGMPLLQKATGLAPDAVEIRYHLAVALQKSGDKQGARRELDKVLAQNAPFPQIEQARELRKNL